MFRCDSSPLERTLYLSTGDLIPVRVPSPRGRESKRGNIPDARRIPLLYNPGMAHSTIRSRDSRSKPAPKKRGVGDSNNRFIQLEQKITPLLKTYVMRISVFGSYARGEETAKSDIDLLVALKPSHLRPALGLFDFIRLEQELKKELGREVDLVTEEGLNQRRKPAIEKDRVVLYEE
jgi:predicted nucleotidyltransferase